MAKPQNLQWSLSGEVFWSIWRVLLRALNTQTLLAQKGTCTEANIIPPYLQPFHPGLCTMSFTVFRQKGEGGMWANFAHLDLRAIVATHTHFPSLSPAKVQRFVFLVPDFAPCLHLQHCKDYCILIQALQPWNIAEPKQKWITKAHFLQWVISGEWCLQNAALIQPTLLLCGCFLWILGNILKQNQGLIIKTELSDAKVYSSKLSKKKRVTLVRHKLPQS